ncbi:MAG TPA: hypothetical protein VMB02_07240, partial [Candidatus Aquilonibacter sp.]|nr:hypothetical protein [Candidatus Aquilonibacter sp.]
EPILVRLVDDGGLKPFEEQSLALARDTLAIGRRAERIAIGAFVAAAIAAVFLYFQVKEISYQTQITASQVQGDAASASLSAIQVQRQLVIARQTLSVDQRAWIAIWPTTAIVQVGVPLGAGLKLQQLGKTPARNCELRMRVETVKDIKHVRFEFNKGDTINRAEMQTILPTAIINLQIEEPDKMTTQRLLLRSLDKTRFDAITKGDIQFFVHGKLTYDDAFSVHHWVEFCFYYEPNLILRTGPDTPFTNCQEHNDIDDNLE